MIFKCIFKVRKLICVALILSSLFLLGGCDNASKEPTKTEEFIMSTIITQTVYGKNSELAANNVNELLKKLENDFSIYVEDSYISQINKNAGLSPVKVNDYTFDLLKTATEYSAMSQSLFDITVAPLSKLWAIESDSPHIPTQEELARVLPLIDYRNVEFNDDNMTVFLKEKGMSIDLGGIAKGYFIQRVKEEYEKQGVSSAICSVGGNIFTFGKKPDGKEFVVGIRDPQGETSNSYMGKLKSTDETIATTGKYERYFENDGIKYHHVLDLSTGFPSESDLQSVTVVSSDGGLADYLSTTLFLAGSDAIKSYLNDTRFSVLVIDNNNQVYCSNAIKGRFTITNNKYVLIEE